MTGPHASSAYDRTDRGAGLRRPAADPHDEGMTQPEPTGSPPRDATGDHRDDHPVEARQRCGPYRLDFYATPDAVVCVVTDELVVS